MRVLRTGFWMVVLVLGGLMIARVLASFTFAAGAVTHTLAVMFNPAEAQRTVTDALRGFQSVSGTLGPRPGTYRTMSVLDVPAEIEARRKAGRLEARSGGPLIIRIGE